ncbi:MAG: pitrilysin family protein [Chloroflexota bacterium]
MDITWEIGKLPDGMRVVTTPVPGAQSVSVNVFVGAGSRGENKKNMGVAHFLEHMVFKGTPKHPTAIALAETIEGAGGVLNAYTSKELTCYWNHVPFDQLETAIDVLADMLRNSFLDPEEIDRERSVVQQEIRRTQDQPGAYAGELLGKAVYGDHQMGWPTAGTEDTVGGIQRDDFQGWIDVWYGAPNIVLSVAGNTTHEEVMKLANQYFLDGRKIAPPLMQPITNSIPTQRVIGEIRPITQANVAIGLPAVSRNDPDRYVLMILNAVLGRGMSSRLFKEVRERRGLAYSVGSSVSRYSDTGMLGVSAGVSPEKLAEAVEVILEELEKMKDELVGAEELKKARDYTIGSFRLSLESTMALGQRAGESLLTLGEIEPIENVVEKLRAVTPEDVLRVAQRILLREKAAVALVGPELPEESLTALLTRKV